MALYIECLYHVITTLLPQTMGQSGNQQSQSLTVRDNRTANTYTIPCVATVMYLSNGNLTIMPSIKDNSIQATAFKNIKAPVGPNERPENESDKGLRIADKGYLNTAVMRSEITYINGEAGSASESFVMLAVLIMTARFQSCVIGSELNASIFYLVSYGVGVIQSSSSQSVRITWRLVSDRGGIQMLVLTELKRIY
jgi:hypothetical protein